LPIQARIAGRRRPRSNSQQKIVLPAAKVVAPTLYSPPFTLKTKPAIAGAAADIDGSCAPVVASQIMPTDNATDTVVATPSATLQKAPNRARSSSSAFVSPRSVTASVIAQNALSRPRTSATERTPTFCDIVASRAAGFAPAVARPDRTMSGNATPMYSR
jgi:hypothetical protein